MFDIAWSEMIVIGAVALIAIGPKDLPKALRTVGAMTAKARRMASEFQDHFREAMREAELDGVKEEMAKLNNELSAATTGIQSEFNSIGQEMPSASDVSASTPSSSVATPGHEGDAAKPGTSISVEAAPGSLTVTETAEPAKPAAKPARKKRATKRQMQEALAGAAVSDTSDAGQPTAAQKPRRVRKPKIGPGKAASAKPISADAEASLFDVVPPAGSAPALANGAGQPAAAKPRRRVAKAVTPPAAAPLSIVPAAEPTASSDSGTGGHVSGDDKAA